MQVGEHKFSASVAEIKAFLGTYDLDIIEWMKKDPKYCLKMQQTLDMFVADIFRQRDIIPDVSDTFKRKFIHKLCDRYCIERFVDPKKGVIVIQKSPNSIIPKKSLKDYYNEYVTLKKSIPEKKIILRTRETNLDERSSNRNQDDGPNDSVKEHQKNQQQKLDELQIKNEHYQKIKHKYFEGQDPQQTLFEAPTPQSRQPNDASASQSKSSKLKLSSKSFDPEFIRDEPIGYGQPSWQNSYYPPGLL